jgi:SAM-dependent methyltransferase
MRFPGWGFLRNIARSNRSALRGQRLPLAGQFQAYSHTLPDRYPWLFQFAARELGATREQRLLSFGCSRGDEVFALRHYFQKAEIKGIDIDPDNIAVCQERASRQQLSNVSFETAASTEAEETASYDAIFCLAVLCLGDLTTHGAQRCDPQLHFADFERLVADFSRCLKPAGLLLLHTTNFRFADTLVFGSFETLLEAEPGQMAPDVQFGRDNRLIPGPRYRAVVFRKRDLTT